MRINRTKNTIRNSVWGFIHRIVTLICPFITRTCIIYLLGTQYVGLNSLFTSIISVLSLAELGFGTAIVYSMYQPIADEDGEKICALMNLYRKVYWVMGCVVFAVGAMLIPFIPYFIKDTVPDTINIYLLYIIYLANSVISYWLFAYKNCLLSAFQRNDISHKVATVINLFMYICQIVLLCIYKNYYFYVFCIPIFSALTNIVTAIFVDKYFPQYQCSGNVDKTEIHGLEKQVVGLLAQRLAFSSRNAFDSIIISSFLGLTVVGIYNNYFYLLNAVTAMLSLIFTSMQGGIGNSIAKESIEKNYIDFKKINFMYLWISGWCSICLLCLMQPFMQIWVGKDNMFPMQYVLLLAFYFWTMKMTDPIGAYIAGTGIWWGCKYIYLLEAAVNLILNISLGYFWGVIGVIFATIISVVFVNFVMTTYMLYRHYFAAYIFTDAIIDNLKYTFVTIVAGAITFYTSALIDFNGRNIQLILSLFFKGIICCIIPNVVFYLFYRKDEQFALSNKWILQKIKGV